MCVLKVECITAAHVQFTLTGDIFGVGLCVISLLVIKFVLPQI